MLSILDDKRKKGEDIGEGDELSAWARVHLGVALAALGRRADAETLLVEAVPQLPLRTADTTRALRFLVGFYDEWNRSQPETARAEPKSGGGASNRRPGLPSPDSSAVKSAGVCD